MTVLRNIAERTFNLGAFPFQSPEANLPAGTRTVTFTLTTPSWPAVSDGEITIALLLSRQGGAFAQEWSDTFLHKESRRGGVLQPSIILSATLQSPFISGDKVILSADATVGFTSAVTIEAT